MKLRKYIFIIFMVLFLMFNDVSVKKVVVHNIDRLTAATEAGFVDENFYSCVVESSGKTEGSVLTDVELASINELICKNKKVNDITGIEKLTGLTSLNLMENNLSKVNLSNNPNLVYVELSGNPLITSIDLSKNVNLKEIYFRNDSIKSIDLSNNVNLENLDLGINELEKIDLSKNTNLKYLYLGSNKLTEIDLTNNINLIEVTLSANKLTSIDISKNTNLIKFYASSNQLSSLDLSNNDSIERMDISSNKISSIDISNLTNLKAVALSANKLTSLNVKNNTLLESLYASSNQLTSIDITNNTNLINIDLSDNKISNIDVDNNLKLDYLKLSKNKLFSIDIKNNTLLRELVLSANQLSSIDLSNNVNLKELYISSNNLTNLDLTKLSKLVSLNAVLNKFDNLSISNPSNIIDLVVEADWIANYNFDEFTNMKSLRVVDYYVVPVYGTSFNKYNLSKYKASNVSYNENVLYTDFDKDGSSYIHSSDTINGSLGSTLKYRVCATNISDYHNYCGGEDVFDNITKIVVDSNVSANDIENYSGIVYYEGYREFRFMNLTSDKYLIDESKSIIDVGGDSDDVIKSNLNVSYKDAVIDINGNSLKVSYNGELIREFTLERIDNPGTGSLSIFITIGVMIICFIGVVIYKRKALDNRI